MTQAKGLGACARAGVVALILFVDCGSALAAQAVKKLTALPAASAPALELTDIQGKSHRLTDYRGKVVLVNFWATWCEPCRDEMPSMQTLYRRMGPASEGDLVVLAVNYAENAPRIGQFLRQQALDFPILMDPFSEAWRAWKPGMLPASYLVGRDGRVRYRALGEIDWAGLEAEAVVLRLLREKR